MTDERRSPPDRSSPDGSGDEGLVRRIWAAEGGALFWLRELGTSLAVVVLVGLVLFAASGVWPPMVAVESGSMEPHMHKGDLVFITGPDRYAPDAAHDATSVVTAKAGRESGYRTFGGYGSVVVYASPSRTGAPVIHRARFWVERGENWYDEANPDYVAGDSCDEIPNCPAPHAGFITKGDANAHYDQVSGISDPVRPSWIVGVARVRVPYLGWVRLGLANVVLDAVPAGPPQSVVPVDHRSLALPPDVDPSVSGGRPLETNASLAG